MSIDPQQLLVLARVLSVYIPPHLVAPAAAAGAAAVKPGSTVESVAAAVAAALPPPYDTAAKIALWLGPVVVKWLEPSVEAAAGIEVVDERS